MPSPRYADAQASLYLAEALAVLAELPDGSADAIVTDPPYSSGGAFRGDRTAVTGGKYSRGVAAAAVADFDGDSRDQRGHRYWTALWLSESLRVVRPGGACLLFSDWRQLPTTTDAIQAGGWVWRGVVPWAKEFGGRGCRPEIGRFASQCEYVVWGSRGALAANTAVGALPGWYVGRAPRGAGRVHHAEKPVEVMREMVRIAPPGGLVVDPFMGSGTTGVACAQVERRFLGVERSGVHYRQAERRILAARAEAVA